MNIDRIKDKIKELKSMPEQGWHESMLTQIALWEKQLNDIELDESYLDLPQTKKLAEYAQVRIKDAEKQLSTNRELTEDERNYLFVVKDICSQEITMLSKSDSESVVDNIERQVDLESEPYVKKSYKKLKK